MAMLRKVQAKIKTCNKEEIKTASNMCRKCGIVLTNDSKACPNCVKPS